MDDLNRAQAKIQNIINSVTFSVAGVPSRLFGSQEFRRAYFIVEEATYCNDVTNDTDRLNTLLAFSTAQIPYIPRRSNAQ